MPNFTRHQRIIYRTHQTFRREASPGQVAISRGHAFSSRSAQHCPVRLVTTTRTCAGVHQAWSPGRRARRQSQVRTGCREEGFALLSCRCRSALPSVYACLEPVINLSLAAATNQGKWRRPGCRKTAGAVNLILSPLGGEAS